MSSGNSSADRSGPFGSLFGRVKGFKDARVADLVLDRGWVAPAHLRQLQERIDQGGTPLDLFGLLKQDRLLTPEQIHEVESRLPFLEMERVSTVAAPPGARFGKFILSEEIGRGGMGIVHKAWQSDIGRWVALKQLKSDLNPSRFLREGRLAAQVIHPNLVPIYEVGQFDGVPYIAMALIEGGTLERERLPIKRALEIIMTIARAAQELHAAGIVHRDIKPGNLLTDAKGRIYLGDFSLARQEESGPSLTRTGFMLGTPAYAPPEQIRGDSARVGPASDVYSLGATLYSLLTGEPPFTGKDGFQVAQSSLGGEPRPLRSVRPDVSHQIETIVGKAMRKAPEDRYRSAGELADDIQRYLNGETLLARPPGFSERMVYAVRRHRIGLGIVTALLCAAGTFAAIWTMQKNEAKRAADRIDLAWRAEVVTRDPIEWAEVHCHTGIKPSPEELAAQREELTADLRDIAARDPVIAESLKLRFESLLGSTGAWDGKFEALLAAHPEYGVIRIQRGRARLVRYLASIPLTGIFIQGRGQLSQLPRRPTVQSKALQAQVLADFEGASTSPIEIVLRGVGAMMRGETRETILLLKQGVDRPETRDESLGLLGFAQFVADDLEGAVASWSRALERRPRRVDLQVYRDVIQAMLALRNSKWDQVDEVLADLSKVVEKFPRWSQGWCWRGMVGYTRVLAAGGSVPDYRARLTQAAEDFRQAVALTGYAPRQEINRAATLAGLAHLDKERNGDDVGPALLEAIALLDAVRIKPDDPEVAAITAMRLINRAGYQLKYGMSKGGAEGEPRLRAALADFDEAFRLEEPTPQAVSMRGFCASQIYWLGLDRNQPELSMWERAVADLEKAVVDSGGAVPLRLTAARAYLDKFQREHDRSGLATAIEHAGAAIAQGTDTAEVWRMRGFGQYQLALQRNDVELHRRAIEDLTRSIAREKLFESFLDRAMALINVAKLAAEPELVDRALRDCEEAAALKPADAKAPFHSGLIYMVSNRRDDALRSFEKARTLAKSEQDLRMIDEQLDRLR